jgi:hypothetical protein
MTHCPFCKKEFKDENFKIPWYKLCSDDNSSCNNHIRRVTISNAIYDNNFFKIYLVNSIDYDICNSFRGLSITIDNQEFKFPKVEKTEEGMLEAYNLYLKLKKLQAFQ